MNLSVLTDMVLGFALVLFQQQKQKDAVEYVEKIIALKAAGANVKAHMQAVADSLTSGEKLDFKDLKARIEAEGEELQARNAPAEEPEPVPLEEAGEEAEAEAEAEAEDPPAAPEAAKPAASKKK